MSSVLNIEHPVIEEVFFAVKELLLLKLSKSEHWLDYCSASMDVDMRPLKQALFHAFLALDKPKLPSHLSNVQRQLIAERICQGVEVVAGHHTSPFKDLSAKADNDIINAALRDAFSPR